MTGAAPARCWFCREAVDPDDEYCRHCGRGQGSRIPFRYRPMGIALLSLFVLGPFGIWLVWKSPLIAGRRAKWIWSAAILAAWTYLGWRIVRDVQEAMREISRLGL